MAYFTKRYHPPGTPPGTLTEYKTDIPIPLTIHLVDYTDEELIEKKVATTKDCLEYLNRDSITWIHIQGSNNLSTLSELGMMFDLHPLALEDISNFGQRPKIDDYDDQLFSIMALPIFDNRHIRIEQVSFFLSKNYIISFHESEVDPFEPVRTRLRNKAGKIRTRSVDYLFYCLLDLIVDKCFPLLEQLGSQIENLEIELLQSPTKNTLGEIHHIKRELLLLRRVLWPQRDVLNRIIHDEYPHINQETLVYFKDCYDHTIQIMDLLESYRETSSSMLDIYLSSVSQRLNEAMRSLTIIATIFMPLTFIVGVYGMNFSINPDSPWAMPELHWKYGYPAVWAVMLAIAFGMWFYFKRKNWW